MLRLSARRLANRRESVFILGLNRHEREVTGEPIMAR